jgi:hypothetical protein
MVGMCTPPAIERVGNGPPHLQRGAPDFYLNRKRKSEPTENANFGLNQV